MIKRLSKARRSAILEHLLALEKQIRAEFGENPDGKTKRPSEDNPRSQRTSALQERPADDNRVIASEFAARSMH
jgi:hypothetical protein